MSDPTAQPTIKDIHPLDAINAVNSELGKIASFLNAIKLVHDIKLQNIEPSFILLDKLLSGLQKYQIEEMRKQAQPQNRQARRAAERESEKIEKKIAQEIENNKQNTEKEEPTTLQ